MARRAWPAAPHCPQAGSQVFYNLAYGAMIVEASVQRIELRFITIHEYEADRFVMMK